MTICISDVYRNEEGLWLVFGFKEKEEGGRMLMAQKDHRGEPMPFTGNITIHTTPFKIPEGQDPTDQYVIIKAWAGAMRRKSLYARLVGNRAVEMFNAAFSKPPSKSRMRKNIKRVKR